MQRSTIFPYQETPLANNAKLQGRIEELQRIVPRCSSSSTADCPQAIGVMCSSLVVLENGVVTLDGTLSLGCDWIFKHARRRNCRRRAVEEP